MKISRVSLLLTNKLAQLFILYILSSCSSTSDKNINVKLEQDAFVTVGEGSPSAMKKGDQFELSSVSTLIQQPGFVSLMIVPESHNHSEVKVALKPLDTWASDYQKKVNSRVITEILSGINDVQSKIADKNIGQALEAVNALKSKHPDVVYIDFLKASCLVLAGDNQKAIGILDNALKEFPDNAPAQKLYKRLTMGESGTGSLEGK